MKKDIKIIMPPKKKEEDEAGEAKRRSDWPTMLPTDEPLSLPTEISFFDGLTRKKEDGTWEDVAEWNNDYDADPDEEDNTPMSKQWEHFYQCRGPLSPFDINPKDTTIKIYASLDSRPKPSVIENEFGVQNEKRFERKPLLSMAEDWEQEGHRWIQGGSFYYSHEGSDPIYYDRMAPHNIQCVLKSGKEGEPFAIIEPSSFHSEEAKRLKLKYPFHANDLMPLIYRGYGVGKYGIQVKDLSKSYVHYLAGSTPSYSYDWIDGVYFCPFDTLDDTNFKITKEPSYDSAEVSGKFIDGRKFDVFLIPRRWAFVSYYRHSERTDSYVESNPGSDCYYESRDPAAYPYIDVCLKYHYNAVSGALKGWITNSTYLVGIMYGRFPCNMAINNYGDRDMGIFTEEGVIAYNTSQAPIYYCNSNGADVLTKNIIWEENLDGAKEHFLAAGGSQEDADKIYSGAGSSFHVIRDDTPYFVRVSSEYNYGPVSLDAVKHGRNATPPIFRSDKWLYDNADVLPHDNIGPKPIWDIIENSEYWQSIVAPLREEAKNAGTFSEEALFASRVDMIPYGVGVCESKAESLVGVIRSGGTAWFIWRKTDENFEEEKIIHVVGEGQAHLSFQSRNPDGRLEHFSEGKYESSAAQGINAYDGDVTDQFTSDGSRKLVSVGREVSIEDSGEVANNSYMERHGGGTVPI
jgi:hypothetical protein